MCHIIHEDGVSVDQSKILAIQEWPKPHNIQILRGFLGLAWFYRKFIRNYGIIAAPLTGMLRRNWFVWSDESDTAFTFLKQALSESPVLALPKFTITFIAKCDASGSGVGTVLQQHNHPIAFSAKSLQIDTISFQHMSGS